ncbi:MAG TPA: serine hydrolase domain-containing protein [Thermoanaerobaculia bacterium]|nr:serine hydrolase domain-containing protein [Thermoanaerobaculia bacterium]
MSFVLLALLLAPMSAAQPPSRGNPDVNFDGQSVDQMIAAYVRENEVPGISLAIVQAPYITRATGYGIADVQRNSLVSANAMFNIVQMRSAFTAVAAMQLVEEGKLGRSQVLPLLRKPELESLIAKASGQRYEEFVRSRQFEPLGLRHTAFANDLPKPALIDPAEPAVGNGVPSDNAIYSSASDISIWDIALAGDILIKDPALRKLLYEPSPDRGPWFFPGHPGLMIATGDGEGFSSLLARFTHRDELICVTLLANREGLDLTQLARKIAGAFNRRTGPPARSAGLSAQQSPYSVSESVTRVANALRARGLAPTGVLPHAVEGAFGKITVSEESGAVWIIATPAGKTPRETRRKIDEALLEAIGARDAYLQ